MRPRFTRSENRSIVSYALVTSVVRVNVCGRRLKGTKYHKTARSLEFPQNVVICIWLFVYLYVANKAVIYEWLSLKRGTGNRGIEWRNRMERRKPGTRKYGIIPGFKDPMFSRYPAFKDVIFSRSAF